MSWLKLARKANEYAEAKAQHSFNEHADPKVQLEQAITALQAHQQELEEAASHVLAQEKMARMRLADLSNKEAKLTASAQAAMASGHQDAAAPSPCNSHRSASRSRASRLRFLSSRRPPTTPGRQSRKGSTCCSRSSTSEAPC